MKTNICSKNVIALAVWALIACTAFISCTSPAKKVENAQENVEDANKALEKANQEYLADIEKYRVETNEKIIANEKSLLEFKIQVANEKKEVKAEYNRKIAELEAKNANMKRNMDEYKPDGKDNWENFKLEFNRDMNELGDALRDLTVKNNK